MEEFRLDTFPDGLLIDDLVIGPGSLSIRLVGAARYEIAMACNTGRQLALTTWTSGKGKTSTRLRDVAPWAIARLGDDGNLDALSAADCLMHLEHMDRGCYWMGLDHSGDTMHIDFLTRGYLKTRVLTHVKPGAER